MNPSIASLIVACGIIGIFYLDRDSTTRTSKALWLPVSYLWITGSRPVSAWLGITPAAHRNVQLEGSPLDAAIFGLLLIAAIAVLVLRSKRTLPLLTANWPILLYFLYCLVSVLWSHHPDVAFKRWIKSLCDPAMCLIIVTDPRPVAALKRLISRVGFLLLPTSVLLIKYYGDLGRGYTPDGMPMNTGVTTFKNELGATVLVISLCTAWHLITLLKTRNQPNRARHLLVQATLLSFGVSLLVMANSRTSTACFVLGWGLMLATGLRMFRRRPARIHLLCSVIFLVGASVLIFGGGSGLMQTMDKNSNLSGRTDIWEALIESAPNRIIGAGFESFWISPNVRVFVHILEAKQWWHPEQLNEAHNGYLEVYLNLGLIGLGLMFVALVHSYKNAVDAFRRNSSAAGLMLVFIITSAFYNITEAGFRFIYIMWFFLLFAIISSVGIAAGILEGETARIPGARNSRVKIGSASPQLIPEEAASVTSNADYAV